MAERDWWRTVGQTLPRLATVLRHLRPTYTLGGLEALDPAFCVEHGVRGLIWDVDGTLTSYHGGQIAADIRDAAEALFDARDLRHVILSNCGEARFHELGRIFPGVPVLKAYLSDGGTVRRRLEGSRETWTGADRTEQMVPIRKPSPELIRFALDELGIEPSEALMVGDQHWTDVAGARMAGVRSVKLPTLHRETFPFALRALQRLEGQLSHLTARVQRAGA